MGDLNDSANRVITTSFHALDGKAVSTCKLESVVNKYWVEDAFPFGATLVSANARTYFRVTSSSGFKVS